MSEKQFLQLVRDNRGIIYKIVNLYAADPEEQKDLRQEILLQAWRSWPAFKGEAKFSTWLYRVAINTVLTLKRKKAPVDYKDNLEAVSPRVDEEWKDEAQRLYSAIRRLSETDRAIISMHLDGYDNPEISGVIGISNNHVSVKLHRIKQQLSTMLNQ